MIWNKEYESMPLDQKRELQLKRLQNTVKLVYEKVPHYRKTFDAKGVHPDDLQRIEDISKFPFTSKADLRDNYPFNLFAVPMKEIVRIHSSSGTTGKPTVVGYTRNDIDLWAELMARTLACGDTTDEDVVHVAYGYGLFTGGLGAHYGAERIGATVIPISGGNTKRQLMIMQDFGSTILCCTPSYALNMAEVAMESGVDLSKIKLKTGLFGAEPWTDNMRREIEEKMHLDAIDIYGLSEVIGPGVSSECLEKVGLHIFDDHFYAEIIDPETGNVLPPGEEGELVFTSLTKEAFPIVRYRTRDITTLIEEPCACGRTSVRMKRAAGRTDDMIIIRGVNVFPSQIESVLIGIPEVEPHYQINLFREGSMDNIEILVEVSESVFNDEIKTLQNLKHKIQDEIDSVLALRARIKLVEPKTIARSEGKAKRVVDNRPKE